MCLFIHSNFTDKRWLTKCVFIQLYRNEQHISEVKTLQMCLMINCCCVVSFSLHQISVNSHWTQTQWTQNSNCLTTTGRWQWWQSSSHILIIQTDLTASHLFSSSFSLVLYLPQLTTEGQHCIGGISESWREAASGAPLLPTNGYEWNMESVCAPIVHFKSRKHTQTSRLYKDTIKRRTSSGTHLQLSNSVASILISVTRQGQENKQRLPPRCCKSLRSGYLFSTWCFPDLPLPFSPLLLLLCSLW